jgi:hypothetical protein
MVYLSLDMAGEDPQNYWQNPENDQAVQPEAPTTQPETELVAEPTPLAPEDTPNNPPVTWTAQEYVHLERSPLWFIGFVIVVLGLIAVDVFLLKSWTFSALVIVMAIALVIYIRRPPRKLTYALSPAQGLYVGEQLYHMDEFKAFGLIKDGPHYSILLIPRKRFAPGVSVYFPDDAGERIVDILGQQLPMENLKLDIVDVIVRKLRL